LPTATEETDFARAADKIIEDLSLKREELRRRALAVCEEKFVWPRYREELRRAYGLADNDI
jgi:hypothetical protein